jgi:N-acetylglucosamine-6-phosphate deacetylase
MPVQTVYNGQGGTVANEKEVLHMLLTNAYVLLGNFVFQKCDVLLANGKIAQIMPCGFLQDEDTLDCEGSYLLPGLIDVHTHGCDGVDTVGGGYEGINRMSRFMAQHGVTSFLPTSETVSYEEIESAFRSVKEAYDKGCDGAEVMGINMEGPYINPGKAGAQDPQYAVAASFEDFCKLQEAAGGLIRLITVAPEMPGNMEFIRKAAASGVHVSCGHSTAGYDEIIQAAENGADHMTHLYNAMTPLTHRDPNAVGAALTTDKLYCEVICDGIHLHKAAVLTAYKMKGSDRMLLISDSMMATGLPDGKYQIGGLDVWVRDGVARIEAGNLAGSTAKLLGCVCKAVEFGIPLEDAVKMASLTPAKSVGIDHTKGSIELGKDADVIIVGQDLALQKTIVGGKVVFSSKV